MVAKLELKNFRNFKKKSLEFSKGITVIVGDNAVGKTNILEAISLLSTGKSFKAKIEGEMLQYSSDIARITGNTSNNSSEGNTKLEAIITKGENGWPKKRLLINGVPKRLLDFAGNFKTVLFGPWDLDLVTESPSLRRKFLDSVLSQTDREYRRASLSYEKGVRQRNRLLFRIREEELSRSQLLFWDQLLIKTGNYITEARENFIDFCNSQPNLQSTDYSLLYDRSVISEGRLAQYKNEEVASAATLVGPHRDDFIFFKMLNDKKVNAKLEQRELAAYGSRGEQRMGILWLKMAELNYIEKEGIKSGTETSSARPTLLLDDIFSELDHEHRDVVMELAQKQQTIITTADEHFVEKFGGRGIIRL